MAAAPPALFPETDTLKEGVHALNRATTDKLGLVLSKVIGACGSSAAWPFSAEEEHQLCGILGVDARTTATVLEVAAYIFETAAYHNLKTAVLGQNLLAIGVSEAAAVAIGQTWTTESAALIARLRAQQLGAPGTLLGTSWRLNLGVGSTAASSTKATEAVVDFRIGSGGGQAPGTVSIAFSQSSLTSFLEKLDTLQGQLDALS